MNKKPLNQKTFKCTFCGECCRPLVKVSEKDILKIEELGIDGNDFLDYDPLDKKAKSVLKQKNNVCFFLKRRGEKYYCGIYDHRPDNCRRYPFYKKEVKIYGCKPLHLRPLKPLSFLVPDEETVAKKNQ